MSRNRHDGPGNSWVAASAYLLAGWLPVVLLTYLLRESILDARGGGYEFVAQALGRPEVPLLQKLALFRMDFLIVVLVIPLAVMLLIRRMGPRARGVVVVAIVVPFLSVLAIERACFIEVGTFLPIAVLQAGTTDVGRAFFLEYVPWGSLLKFAALIGIASVLPTLTTLLDRRHELDHRPLVLGVATAWLAILAMAGASWLVPLPPNPFQSSALVEATASFAGLTQQPLLPPRQGPKSAPQLVAEYRALTHAPIPNRADPYTGRARGYDVLFLVLETAPAECLDFDRPDGLPPTMRRLAATSFVATEHFTTYPLTVRAIFSIFSSWYPSNSPTTFIKQLGKTHWDLLAPGVVRSAKSAGYRTSVFAPEPVENWERDDLRYHALGFDDWFTPPAPKFFEWSDTTVTRRSMAEAEDMKALALLKDEIARAIGAGQRYLFSFQPQYSHGPWPGITATSTYDDVTAACKPLFATIDGWLGQVTDLLAARDRLDQTLIVVVGDHGIRTRSEYPGLAAGVQHDLTYHVPLLVYVPGVLTAPVRIDHLTSHIDIAPTVSDLLGFTEDRALEQGSPIWNPAIAGRTTFLFGRNYVGADGFVAGDKADMYNYAIKSAYSAPWNGHLGFSLQDLVPPSSDEAERIADTIGEMTNLQRRWAGLMVAEKYREAMVAPAPGAR
ncbi:MAG TPA: sulfatase-like hydrolase/transferase [Gemmatimonadales bacterium]|nr:sulfatase-like hydrolase/transferase [Gemmatimonadales bacterium]